MRENRPYGSEGGVAMSHPDPYHSAGELHGPVNLFKGQNLGAIGQVRPAATARLRLSRIVLRATPSSHAILRALTPS
jgi:hypothetical protein